MTRLFILWFLVTASDAIGAGLATILLFKIGTRYSRFQAVVFAVIAVEAAAAAASLILFWPQEAEVAPVFALTRSVARGMKASGVWCYAFYLFNLCDRNRRRGLTSGAR
jgi:ABC-type anion transport system duplicated permease subunit